MRGSDTTHGWKLFTGERVKESTGGRLFTGERMKESTGGMLSTGKRVGESMDGRLLKGVGLRHNAGWRSSRGGVLTQCGGGGYTKVRG